jgi:hypothetical protein
MLRSVDLEHEGHSVAFDALTRVANERLSHFVVRGPDAARPDAMKVNLDGLADRLRILLGKSEPCISERRVELRVQFNETLSRSGPRTLLPDEDAPPLPLGPYINTVDDVGVLHGHGRRLGQRRWDVEVVQ